MIVCVLLLSRCVLHFNCKIFLFFSILLLTVRLTEQSFACFQSCINDVIMPRSLTQLRLLFAGCCLQNIPLYLQSLTNEDDALKRHYIAQISGCHRWKGVCCLFLLWKLSMAGCLGFVMLWNVMFDIRFLNFYSTYQCMRSLTSDHGNYWLKSRVTDGIVWSYRELVRLTVMWREGFSRRLCLILQ